MQVAPVFALHVLLHLVDFISFIDLVMKNKPTEQQQEHNLEWYRGVPELLNLSPWCCCRDWTRFCEDPQVISHQGCGDHHLTTQDCSNLHISPLKCLLYPQLSASSLKLFHNSRLLFSSHFSWEECVDPHIISQKKLVVILKWLYNTDCGDPEVTSQCRTVVTSKSK